MLQQMRGFARSWVSSLFLLGLALTFGLWGIGDIFRGGSGDTSLATVGDVKIEPQAFEREYRNFLRRISRQEGHEVTTEEAHAKGIDRRVLDSEINNTALDQGAKYYGLVAGDAQVSARIRGMGAFRNTLGAFDHSTFETVLAQNGISEQEFIGMVRDDMTRDQILSVAVGGTQVPPGYAKLFFDYVNEHRAADYVVVPAGAITSIPQPSDAQLNAYLRGHASQFSTPEYRDVTYLSIGPDDVANQVKVSDADLRQQYDERKDQYQVPEKRDVEQLTFPDQTAARAARAKIDGGMKFADLAKSMGKSPSDVALGTRVQADLGADRGPPTFALPVDGVTPPIKFTFGWVLLHVTKITPGVNKTFDDVKESLRKEAYAQLATAKLTDVSNAFEDARAGGASFADAAQKVGMHITRISAVDRNGLAPDGSKTNLPTAPEFQSQLARADVGEEGDPFTASDGHDYAIKINGITPSKLKPLDSVRTEVVKAWTNDQRQQLLARLASQLAQKAITDKSLAQVAAQLHAKVQQSEALTHSTQSAVLSRALVAKIFSTQPGGTVFAPSADGNGYVLARVTGVAHPPMPTGDPMFQRFGAEIGQEAGNDMGLAMASAWRDKLGVKMNQPQIDRTFGSSGS